MNGGNLVQGVNSWAVSLIKYSTAFITWRKCDLQAIDRKTRKFFTIYEGLHPKSDVDRLYIPRKDEGRALIAIEGSVELVVRGLQVYVHGSEERLIRAARGDKLDALEPASVLKKAEKKKRFQDWQEKALHGQYLRQTKKIRRVQSRAWLQNGDLKREPESLIVAVLNQEYKNKLS